ncbi:MAG: DUF4198 domain-containing protein [Desulfobacteraceae bacterium]|nr:DUF4198 domain-containing protein [Desulfobacteraceae bacterium]
MKLKMISTIILAVSLVFLFGNNCFAHYGMVIPSDTMIMQNENREIKLDLSFSHPFELEGMELIKPKAFFVVKNKNRQVLLDGLTPATIMDNPAWTTKFFVKNPGAYTFIMEPAPYWEPAEDIYIIHYTKTVVAAFGDDTGWDEELGLKTEIIPLARPFGLYAGNLFQGVVKMDGKPVPHAQVAIVFYNQDKKVVAPTDYMSTQKITADQNGVFSYCVPAPGWWGFKAFNVSDKKMMHNGEVKQIALGAILWIKFEVWPEK